MLPGLFKHGVGQDGIGTLTVSAAVGGEVVVATEQPAVRALAARAHQASRMEVLLKLDDIRRPIKQVGQGQVNHAR